MKYWWVNHKQTFKAEIDGGYIWSPKENKNGSRNKTYLNLTRTNPGDIVFSYANAKIQAVGIVVKKCSSQRKPAEFGKAGDAWNSSGWIVLIDWEMINYAISPKSHLNEIVSLLPEKNSPIQKNGNGNQSCYLASISEEFGIKLLELINKKNSFLFDAIVTKEIEIEEDGLEEEVNNLNVDETEKEQLVKSRRGQGVFRSRVEEIEKSCRVTGVSVKNVLIASHMKPWRISTNQERLDGNNGFLLSPHIDKLFDKGWISFKENGDLLTANEEVKRILQLWSIQPLLNVGSFNQKQLQYLEYHRNKIFNKS